MLLGVRIVSEAAFLGLLCPGLHCHFLHLLFGLPDGLEALLERGCFAGRLVEFAPQVPSRGKHLLLEVEQLGGSLLAFAFALVSVLLPVDLLKRPYSAEEKIALDASDAVVADAVLRPEEPCNRVARDGLPRLKRLEMMHALLLRCPGVVPEHDLHGRLRAQCERDSPALETGLVPDFRLEVHFLQGSEPCVRPGKQGADFRRFVWKHLYVKCRLFLSAPAVEILEIELGLDGGRCRRDRPVDRVGVKTGLQQFDAPVLVREAGGLYRLVEQQRPVDAGSLWNRQLSCVLKDAFAGVGPLRIADRRGRLFQLRVLEGADFINRGFARGRLHPVLQVPVDGVQRGAIERLRKRLLHGRADGVGALLLGVEIHSRAGLCQPCAD